MLKILNVLYIMYLPKGSSFKLVNRQHGLQPG